MILVPVLHFSNPLSSSRSSCSVLNIEYLRMALRLVSQPSDNARVRGSVKENKHSKFIMLTPVLCDLVTTDTLFT